MLGLILLRLTLFSFDYGASIFSSTGDAKTGNRDAILESTIIVPAVTNHSSTVSNILLWIFRSCILSIIFLHGIGDTGEGWADEIAAIKPPHTKLICPTAPVKPITIYFGQSMPAWYDIRSMTRIDEDTEGIQEASEYIQSLIWKEVEMGISPHRIVLAGFSQGAAMSIYSGLTGNFSLAGIVAMSGYIPAIEKISWDKVQTPPILQLHGELDDIVTFDIGLATKYVFEELEFPNFTFRSYEDLGHSASAKEMQDIQQFFANVLE